MIDGRKRREGQREEELGGDKRDRRLQRGRKMTEVRERARKTQEEGRKEGKEGWREGGRGKKWVGPINTM